MSDPLAHLYAVDELDGEDVEIPTATTSLDELTDETGGPDEIDEHDADELALLVIARLDAGTFSDDEAVELGLGTYDADAFALNDVGRAVFRRILESDVVAYDRLYRGEYRG